MESPRLETIYTMMKKTLLTSILLLLINSFISAQRSVSVGASNTIVGAVSKTIEAPVFNTTKGEIEKEWKKLMKEYNGKVKSSKSEIAAYNTTLTLSGVGKQIIYFKSEIQDDSTCTIIVGASINGESIDADKSNELKKIVRNFAYNLSKTSTSDKLFKANTTLKELKNKKVSLGRDQERQARNIERWKKSIADAELKQKENTNDLNSTDISIIKAELSIQSAEKELREIK